MKRSVNEKYDYNKKRGGDFGEGYCFGVSLYRNYGKNDAATKKTIKEIIDAERVNAHSGDLHSKGVMCGIRDAANERKGKL